MQPRDYINGLQLFIGLGLLYASFAIATPTVVAPAINNNVPADTPSLMPLLFVTIACGAISGFHGTVSSGTTAKQIDRETDGRFVGYFGAVGDGLLALGAVLVTTAGFRTLAEWEEIYSSFENGGVEVFVQAGGTLVNQGLGLPESLSATILATMAVLFAATTMDNAVRLQRYVVQEIGEVFNLKIGMYTATAIAVGVCIALTFSAGADGSGGVLIWPLFGTTNQLLAALTLGIVVVMLMCKGRPFLPALIPMVFVLFVSMFALILQVGQFYNEGNWLLFGLDIMILIAAVWVMIEAILAMVRTKKTRSRTGRRAAARRRREAARRHSTTLGKYNGLVATLQRRPQGVLCGSLPTDLRPRQTRRRRPVHDAGYVRSAGRAQPRFRCHPGIASRNVRPHARMAHPSRTRTVPIRRHELLLKGDPSCC